jgi:5-methylcytosine-specific restriction endonuclease McrBC regulatory subunit McrC
MIPYMIRTFDLYELFVYRWLRQNMADSYSVDYQENAALGDTGLNYKIDDVIRNRDGDPVCVIDTKYREPDSGPKPEEVSQVLGYAKRMGVGHAFLVYPSYIGSGFPLELGDVAIHTEEFSITGDLESNGREFLRRVSSAVGLPSIRA